jgi:hypothetical protein
MMSFILTMVLRQDSISDIQRDIGEVVGDRLPSFEDIPHLPRVRAIVKELVGCTNRIKRLSVGINDWILTEDLSTNK